MNRVPLLVATSGPLKGERFQVTEDGLLVGRDPDCTVTIPDPGVSRQHARVLLYNAAVWVQDAGSRNGVYVNGKRVARPKQLGPGDEMKVGKHAFSLELAPAFPASETSVSVVAPALPDDPQAIPRWVLLLGLVVFLALAVGLALLLR